MFSLPDIFIKYLAGRFVNQLRMCVFDLFSDEPKVEQSEVKRLAKILQTELGRRAFSSALEKAAFQRPEKALTNDAFEMLLYLFNFAMQQMDLEEEDAQDLIAASAILKTSTLIRRQVDDGEEFMHAYLHQYDVFQNVSFWTELFFEELIAKHSAMEADEETAYELDVGITQMLIEMSVGRMIMWDAPLALVQQFLTEVVAQTHLDEDVALELRDKVVMMFSDKNKDKQ